MVDVQVADASLAPSLLMHVWIKTKPFNQYQAIHPEWVNDNDTPVNNRKKNQYSFPHLLLPITTIQVGYGAQ
ncbi:hypothetical protein K2173_005735 [Erythroxylum novogranatense]|uniref:Uncharacterized protein n=1 Tax=Erythroxylum novogranatense TaxID=1862640 RepID=A0AAV8SRQ0_9ROSI|nr:hypothetical protein K2173_005735 [Erythroxylum novogranatense]